LRRKQMDLAAETGGREFDADAGVEQGQDGLAEANGDAARTLALGAGEAYRIEGLSPKCQS